MVRRCFLPIAAIFVLFSILLSCDQDHGLYLTWPGIPLPPPETGDRWETALLLDVGLDPEPLIELEKRFESTPDHEIHSVLIVKDNKLIVDPKS